MKKILFIIAILLILFLGTDLFRSSSNNLTNTQPTQKVSEKITVYQQIIEDKESPLSSEKYEEEKGKTALYLLQKTTSVTIKGSGENAFVTSINTKKASEKDQEYWAFYVNGSASQVGAGSYQLKDGDRIEWKIETY